MNNQILNVLAAGALGDAFGYKVEFSEWAQIKYLYGEKGLQTLENNPDIPVATDDTQMTLFAIEGIVKAYWEIPNPTKDDLVQHARWAFLRWFDSQTWVTRKLPNSIFEDETRLFVRRAPGNTCLKALEHGGFGTLEKPANQSKGCGAVMRSMPYAFLIDRFSDDDIWDIAARSGVITHGHVDGWASGAALAYIGVKLLRGEPFIDSVELAAKKAEGVGAEGTATLIRRAVVVSDTALDPEDLCNTLGEGWTGDEALAISIYAALRAHSAHEAIVIGTNHRGDSDSTASIAGQLAAFRFGMTEIEFAEFDRVDLAPVVRYAAALIQDFIATQST